jgi:hypothetical protein
VWNVPLDAGWVTRTSAGRYHVYWRVADIATAKFTPLQKEIIARTGGDRAILDLPRVMRLPGFPHQKASPYFVEGQASFESRSAPQRNRNALSSGLSAGMNQPRRIGGIAR